MTNKEVVRLAIWAAAGTAIGYGVGYFLTKRRYTKIADEAVDEVKENYRLRYEDGKAPTPSETAEMIAKQHDDPEPVNYSRNVELTELIVKLPEENVDVASQAEIGRKMAEAFLNGAEPVESDAPAPMPVEVNVFETVRNEQHPYIITKDHFHEDWEDFAKIQLTYYAGDNTLADDADSPIDNSVTLVGPDALNKFGLGSNDENVVYVRNERMHTDWEISRIQGSFLEIVLGQPGTASE